MGNGGLQPTLRQLEEFARKVHVPVGTLLLDEPPEESAPIPDYRTVGSGPTPQPSPNLLDTVYLCQERQAWYQDYLRSMGQAVGPGPRGHAAGLADRLERLRRIR